MSILEIIKFMGLDKGLDEYLNKYHKDDPNDKKVRVVCYVTDSIKFFTVGELREANKELKKEQGRL